MNFRVFFEGQCTDWRIFLGVAEILNIYLGCLKFLILWGVNGRCWARAYI